MKNGFFFLGTVLLILTSCTKNQLQQPAFENTELSVNERVTDLLSRMTLEEKVAQTTSYNRQENVYDSLGVFTDEVLKEYAKDGIGIMRFGRLLDQSPYKHTEILNATAWQVPGTLNLSRRFTLLQQRR